MTKVEAGQYKRHLMQRLADSSTKTNINYIKAFWSWAMVNGYVSENIWRGQTKKLSTSTKQQSLDQELLEAAKVKAAKLNDIGFFIQLYTGCRKGEHRGLRWSDIDLKNGWIHFKRYSHGNIVRELKGKEKDERTVPINSKLKTKFLELMPEALTNNKAEPIWPNEFRSGVFGADWAKRCSAHYGFNSHKLRSYVVTQLQFKNVSPFFLHEITRHAVPGLSKVVQGYVRPSEEQIREVLELLE